MSIPLMEKIFIHESSLLSERDLRLGSSMPQLRLPLKLGETSQKFIVVIQVRRLTWSGASGPYDSGVRFG